MKTSQTDVISAPSVRRVLTTPGDIRSEIAFQNDINSLIAKVDQLKMPWKATARLVTYGVDPKLQSPSRPRNTKHPLRVFEGGAPAASPYIRRGA